MMIKVNMGYNPFFAVKGNMTKALALSRFAYFFSIKAADAILRQFRGDITNQCGFTNPGYRLITEHEVVYWKLTYYYKHSIYCLVV